MYEMPNSAVTQQYYSYADVGFGYAQQLPVNIYY